MKTALVLSGGGMFGAWQAGAWSALAASFQPDLVVGASVGSLNGYAIAADWSAQELCDFWRHPMVAGGFRHLPEMIREMMAARPLEIEYAAVLVDPLRMKPRTFVGPEITWQHLAASCAVPGMLAPRRIAGRWHLDGGLLNPVPVWAAVELGATRILALNALPDIPSAVLKPFVRAFRAVLGHHPKLHSSVDLITILPSQRLGSLSDALNWKQENIDRWLALGAADALAAKIPQKNIYRPKCFE